MRGLTDDARHSQLSKGAKPAQVMVDVGSQAVPRAAYGRHSAMELWSEKALTDFTMGGRVTGVAWSLNPYVGCLHACRYCYVPDTIHAERRRWGTYVIAKRNLPLLLRRELRERPRRTVYVSTATDPYQAAEREQRITQSCLRLLAARQWPVDVLTRSPLVVRDLPLLRRIRCLRVGLSVPTLDDEARRLVEPAAPAVTSRLRALRRLADAGLTVYANLSPAYPLTSGVTADYVAETFRDAGVQWVNTSHWRRPETILGPLWDALQGTGHEDLARHAASEPRQVALRRDLQRAFARVGLKLRTGFFNAPFPEAAGDGGARLQTMLAPTAQTEAGATWTPRATAGAVTVVA